MIKRCDRWVWQRWIALVLLLVLTGCTPSLGDRDASGQAVVIGTTARLRTLDPADAYEVLAGTLLYNLGDRLYTYKSGTSELIPQLATTLPEVSEDGLTYRIPLRQGVTFHDGTPFNAAAMVFSLKRFMDSGGQPSSLLAGKIAEVRAIAEYELELRLNQPFVALPELLTFSGLCAVSPTAYGDRQETFLPTQFVGTGPYRLLSYGTDSIRLEPFPDYWGEPAQNPGVSLQIFSSSANLYNSFRTSSIDIAAGALDPNQIQALSQQQSHHPWREITGSGNIISVLSINLRQPPWDQQTARQALAASINRQRLQERVFLGQAEPLYSLVPTIFPASQPDFAQEYGPTTPETAQRWTTQAGFSGDRPLVVNLWYRANVPSNVLAATVLKASLERDLGDLVQVQLDSSESATIYRNLDTGAYPLVLLDWYGDFFDPDNYLEPFLSCDAGSATAGCTSGASFAWGSFFYSPEANQLIKQSRREANPDRRKALFQALQQLNAEQVAFIPLWENKNHLFAQEGIEGLQLEVTQSFSFSRISKQPTP